MFAWWGRTVYRYRFIVIGVMVALCLGGGVFGMSLGGHLTQSGFYDDNSESVRASVLADQVYGRDRTGHIVAVFEVPKGKQADDPQWSKKVADELDAFQKKHSEVLNWVGYLKAVTAPDPGARESAKTLDGMTKTDKDTGRTYTFVSIPLKGDDDDTILNNYKAIAPDLQKLNDGHIELAGLEPVADGLTGTIATDQKRMEVLALPMVAVVLFLVFGGVVAACLPVLVGGLAIAGAMGILRFTAIFGPVHFFAQPAVTLVGLGIAVDYGLFVVSRFREEIAEGYDTEAAVRRTVITAGRTVTFSAVLIAASAVGLLVFPQGFLKSLTYAMIASVMLSAILSITILPAVLGVLGEHVDALGVRTMFRVPFLANWKVSRGYLNWLADLLQKTKTREEVEQEFWGKLVNRVMKRPLLFALPIVVMLILLIVPLGKLSLGGFSEKYLPPDNSVRMAQEHFDKLFPGYRTEQLTLVIQSTDDRPITDQQIAEIRHRAMAVSGFTDPNHDPAEMWQERSYADGGSKDPSVRVIQNGLVNRNEAAKKVSDLRAITAPKGISVLAGGTPALEQDSIHGMFTKMPLMLVILLTTTTLLMFLAFGSVVLPIKATVMSALTLGATMGILTWIFVDGHFAHLLNFTPTPLSAPVIAMIIAVVFGLSTDYEVFLVSRMVEARAQGMSTAEAIRIGTATTGRIITAAALVLAVVAGSFVLSDLVMMKYLAFGLMTALLLDATVVRMFLVPSVMKLLGDDCWWAPRWMKRMQNRIGMGEIYLPAERRRATVRHPRKTPAGASSVAEPTSHPPHDPTHPIAEATGRPDAAGRSQTRPQQTDTPSSAGTTTRMPTGKQDPAEPPTTRFSAVDNPDSTDKPPGAGPEREIESWLDELRDPPASHPPARGGEHSDRSSAPRSSSPSAEPTRSMPAPKDTPGGRPTGLEQDQPTTAIPAQDSQPATEKLNTEKLDTEKLDTAGQAGTETEKIRPRRGNGGGGLSAQELLRREGRY